ncbi:hypothetical protein C0993_002046 [Termitomyces sp. T159_Od127]|nr:hypothetical protein C0993_002046 [Termitomyces sp. T159_Od127]
MVGLEVEAGHEPDLEDNPEEETVWDLISFSFTEEELESEGAPPLTVEEGDKILTSDNDLRPGLQSVFDIMDSPDSVLTDGSLPELQSVSDSSEEEGYPVDPADDGEYWGEIILGSPKDFGENVYVENMPHAEAKSDRLWKEELVRGRPNQLGSAYIRKIEYLLELKQPYPGDPANCLQFWGRRFVAKEVDTNDVRITDLVREYSTTVPKSSIEDSRFEPALWYAYDCHVASGVPFNQMHWYSMALDTDMWAWNASQVLELGAPYLPDEYTRMPVQGGRFKLVRSEEGKFEVTDLLLKFRATIQESLLKNQLFNITRWYERQLEKKLCHLKTEAFGDDEDSFGPGDLFVGNHGDEVQEDSSLDLQQVIGAMKSLRIETMPTTLQVLELNGQQVEAGTYPALLRNNVRRKESSRKVLKPLVIVVKLAGHPVRALVDSGSLGDFVSTTIVEQLKLKKQELPQAIPVLLAVQGSRSKVNYGVMAELEYQNIKGSRYFDVMNLHGYDMILGTPWIYQHQVAIGLNPPRVIIGSRDPAPMIEGVGVTRLSSRAMEQVDQNIEQVREELREYARPICKPAGDTPLPPLRAINHEIPLIEENKIYPWRPSRCPEALRPQWDEKRAAYIHSGRWEVTAHGNAVPMMFLRKPGKPGDPIRL